MKERQVCVRFPPDQVKWLEEQAKKLDRPIAWIIRNLVITEMKKINAQPAKR